MGPIAAITPWNFPLGTTMSKLAPALAAGCTVVIKPSPYTPLSSLRFGDLVRDALPPGVLNIVSGNDSLGSLTTSHPLVRMISFTGSVATGKKIAATAAADLKRVLLELGGNDPAIVLDNATLMRLPTACSQMRSRIVVRFVSPLSGYTLPRRSTVNSSTPWPTGHARRSWVMGGLPELKSGRCAIRHSATALRSS
jgi:Aldehyde dehydrogenase family